MSFGRVGTTQSVAFDSSASITNPIGAQTSKVMLVANSACNVHIYDTTGSATATAADMYLPPNWPVVVTVTSGQMVSAIKAATNGLVTATAGTLWVVELSS